LASHTRTTLVLDALKIARGNADQAPTSIDYTQTLSDHGVLAGVGSVGDAYDNALPESFVGSKLAILEYIGCFSDSRLHQALGDRPPSELNG
jgi:transposase InsO family protein